MVITMVLISMVLIKSSTGGPKYAAGPPGPHGAPWQQEDVSHQQTSIIHHFWPNPVSRCHLLKRLADNAPPSCFCPNAFLLHSLHVCQCECVLHVGQQAWETDGGSGGPKIYDAGAELCLWVLVAGLISLNRPFKWSWGVFCDTNGLMTHYLV